MAIANLDYKICTGCGEKYFEKENNFSRNKSTKDGWQNWCKWCFRIQYQTGKGVKQRKEMKSEPAKIVRNNQLDDLKIKYKDKTGIQIKNPHTDKWEWAKITERHKDFMTVETTRYPTSILWVDMLTGHTKVKEG